MNKTTLWRCTEIRPTDGAQRFEFCAGLAPVDSTHRVIWLMGVDRAPGVQVGDTGHLEFRRRLNGAYFAYTDERNMDTNPQPTDPNVKAFLKQIDRLERINDAIADTKLRHALSDMLVDMRLVAREGHNRRKNGAPVRRNAQPFYHRVDGLLFTSTSGFSEHAFVTALKKLARAAPALGVLEETIQVEPDGYGEPEAGDPSDI